MSGKRNPVGPTPTSTCVKCNQRTPPLGESVCSTCHIMSARGLPVPALPVHGSTPAPAGSVPPYGSHARVQPPAPLHPPEAVDAKTPEQIAKLPQGELRFVFEEQIDTNDPQPDDLVGVYLGDKLVATVPFSEISGKVVK